MSSDRLVNIYRRRTPLTGPGSSCNHCGKAATVTATRRRRGGAVVMPVQYCDDHYQVALATFNVRTDA